MLEKLDSKLQNTYLPRYTSAVRSKKKGLTTGARSNTAQSVSQSVSMSERTGKLAS